MQLTLYDLAYLAIAPPVVATTYYRSKKLGKYRESLPQILGRTIDGEPDEPWANGCIWMHGVSVGETIAAKAMLPALRREFPNVPVLLTTHTETGQAAARGMVPDLAYATRYFPMDFSWVVDKFIAKFRPKLFLPMETELWPNLLLALKREGIPPVMLNGKISEKSFRGYSRLRGLLRKPLSTYEACCVQTDGDRTRLIALGANADKVVVTGNCKFDVTPAILSDEDTLKLRKRCGVSEDARIIIAGSTHPGEEQIMLAALRDLSDILDMTLLIVPRHPERFGAVWKLIVDSEIPAYRVSTGEKIGVVPPRVTLVDEMGILSQLYATAEIAVVAGSFVTNVGGHSLLEPAVYGTPTLHGPHMFSQKEMTRVLNVDSGVLTVTSETLSVQIREWLNDRSLAVRMGQLARAAAMANHGAVDRNMEVIRREVGDRLK